MRLITSPDMIWINFSAGMSPLRVSLPSSPHPTSTTKLIQCNCNWNDCWNHFGFHIFHRIEVSTKLGGCGKYHLCDADTARSPLEPQIWLEGPFSRAHEVCSIYHMRSKIIFDWCKFIWCSVVVVVLVLLLGRHRHFLVSDRNKYTEFINLITNTLKESSVEILLFARNVLEFLQCLLYRNQHLPSINHNEFGKQR